MKKLSVPTGVEQSYPPRGRGAWPGLRLSLGMSVYVCQVNPNIHKAGWAGGGGGDFRQLSRPIFGRFKTTFILNILSFSRDHERKTYE